MFDFLDVSGAQMVIDRVWFAIILVAAAWLTVRLLIPQGIKLAKKVSSYMYDLTNDESGQDSDQFAGGAMDEETRRRIEQIARKRGDHISTGESLSPAVKLETAIRHDSRAAEAQAEKAERGIAKRLGKVWQAMKSRKEAGTFRKTKRSRLDRPKHGKYHPHRDGQWVSCVILGTDQFGRPEISYKIGQETVIQSVRARGKLAA